MNLDQIRVLAVVPARGGSQGIIKKNLKKINGVSLIGHVGEVVKELSWVDKTIISTDDQAMADEGRLYGMDAPFLRPASLATGTATGIDTWKHALLFAEEYYGMRFDISIYLEPTSPCRIAKDVLVTVSTLLEQDCIAAATVSKTPGSFTPHKTLTIDPKGHIGFYLSEGEKYSIRQMIPDYYHRNGICYAVLRDTLLNNNSIIEDNCAAVIIDRPVVNIDEPYDLEMARSILGR